MLILFEVYTLFKGKNYKPDNFVCLLVNSTLYEVMSICYTFAFLRIKDNSDQEYCQFLKNKQKNPLSNVNILKI